MVEPMTDLGPGMTDEQLAAIEAREQAATPGPWRTPADVGDSYDAPALISPGNPVLDHEGCPEWPWAREEDMVFAYSARQDVPALLAEVRRQRRLLTNSATMARETLRQLQEQSDSIGRLALERDRLRAALERLVTVRGSTFEARPLAARVRAIARAALAGQENDRG